MYRHNTRRRISRLELAPSHFTTAIVPTDSSKCEHYGVPIMSKVVLSPSTAAHALRGLALGTSCSLILVSEERRRRLDLARTLADNGRLIRAQRCYSTEPPAGASAQAEKAQAEKAVEDKAIEAPQREDDIVLDRQFSLFHGSPAKKEKVYNPVPRREVRRPTFPTLERHPSPRSGSIAMQGLPASGPQSLTGEDRDTLQEAPFKGRRRMTGNYLVSAFEEDYRSYATQHTLPPEFLESAMHSLEKLQVTDQTWPAQTIIDRLCGHPAIDHRHFQVGKLDGEFVLRCILSDRAGSDTFSRPGRRFKVAVFTFWSLRQLYANSEAPKPESLANLMDILATLFARDTADHYIQSFLATSHVQFGGHMTAKHVVVEIAKQYREQGNAAALDRWLELSDKAGVSIRSCHAGRSLMKAWEVADGENEWWDQAGDRCVPKLKEELRRPLTKEVGNLNKSQLELFEGMDEKMTEGTWQAALDQYNEGLATGVEASVPCLRLAVDAAVSLENIHSADALKLIENAHNSGVDVEPVIQTLLISRFNAIGAQQKASHAPNTRGDAYKAMRKLLDTVRPFYGQPSEMVYNRAIRVCLGVSELSEAQELCLQLAREYWNGDALYMVYNFANLVTVAARRTDYGLLQRLLEALPWRSYQSQPICKDVLKSARVWILRAVGAAGTPAEKQRHENALGYVEIAYQGVLKARALRHRTVRAKLRYQAFSDLTPVRHGEGKGQKRHVGVGGVEVGGVSMREAVRWGPVGEGPPWR